MPAQAPLVCIERWPLETMVSARTGGEAVLCRPTQRYAVQAEKASPRTRARGQRLKRIYVLVHNKLHSISFPLNHLNRPWGGVPQGGLAQNSIRLFPFGTTNHLQEYVVAHNHHFLFELFLHIRLDRSGGVPGERLLAENSRNIFPLCTWPPGP